MSRFLLIDVSFLGHRAFHTTGGLTHRSVGTGVAYGILREVKYLLEWYRPIGTAFCFDSRHSLRAEVYPKYKANRRTYTGAEAKMRNALDEQLTALRREHLPAMGFKTVLQRKGYEADDLIAFLARELHFGDTAVIVAADKDLYQCLTPNVRMYNPVTKKEYTSEDFRKEWGNHPTVWARCKAVAGCKTDNIKGIDGVGEKTAMKWICGNLPDDHPKSRAIVGGLKRVTRNMDLVQLPFPGIPESKYKLRPDRLTRKRWRRVCRSLGIRTVEFPNYEPEGFGVSASPGIPGYNSFRDGEEDPGDEDRPY